MTEQSEIILGDLKKDGKGGTFPICWEFFPVGLCLLKVNNGSAIMEKNKGKRTTSCIPPENVRQPMVVWRFQGVYKTSFWCLNCYLGTDFAHCYVVKTVDFEQVNASWAYLRPNSKSYLPENMLTSVPLNF